MRDAACAGRARTVSAHAAAIATRASLDVLVIPFSPMRSDWPSLMRAPCQLGESATGLILKEKIKNRNRSRAGRRGTACPQAADFAGYLRSQIGRASCRERV